MLKPAKSGIAVPLSAARTIMNDDGTALMRLWREAGRERAGRSLRRPDSPARNGHRGPQSAVVRAQLRMHSDQHAATYPAPSHQMDGSHAGRPCRAFRCGIRGQVHAALDVLGGNRGGQAYGAASAQHVVADARSAVLSIITGGGKWVEMTIQADPLYQHLLLTAERKFWRCVQNGETPRLFGVETPRPRLEAVRIVDMSASNSWADFAATFRKTRPAYQEHESAKTDLKKLVPEDAKEAVGHGLRAKRSKSGAISFELLGVEAGHAAAIQ
jgi:hypothetical protein